MGKLEKQEQGFIDETEKYVKRFYSGKDEEIEGYKLEYKRKTMKRNEARKLDRVNIESCFILAKTKKAKMYLYEISRKINEEGLFFTFLTGN